MKKKYDWVERLLRTLLKITVGMMIGTNIQK